MGATIGTVIEKIGLFESIRSVLEMSCKALIMDAFDEISLEKMV
jgi:hypothetical protein